jgi:glycosyltransferase involved in cell wall biosynthesis
MRVLFLTHAYPRHAGDLPGSFLHLLARSLVRGGTEVRVIAPHEPGLAEQDDVDGIPVWRYRYAAERAETLAYTGTMVEQVKTSLGGKLALTGMLWAAMRTVAREARSWNADVIHAHWWFPSGMSAARASRQLRLPLVTTLHGSDVRLARGVAPARAAFRRVASRSAAVTAVSRYLADRASEMAPGASICTLPMPVEVELFQPPSDESARSPSALLFVGRLTRQKGVDRALQALSRLPDHVTLDVVGDGPERLELETLSQELGLSGRVKWHGARPPSGLPDFYRQAAAVVVPSHEEGLGLVAVEALLCGAPVVAFASGGLVDALDGGDAGTLVSPGDVNALGIALREVIECPHVARERATRGRESVLERHSPQAAANRYRELYERVVAGD